jgi:hypothetical protein
MPRGGARPGSGRPKGSKEPQTLQKEEARSVLRAAVFARMRPLVEAQIQNAEGLKFLMVRDKAGKFVRVGKGEAEKLNPEESIIEVWEKDPSVQAFTDLMNRAIDKPIEQVQADVSGALVIRWKETE